MPNFVYDNTPLFTAKTDGVDNPSISPTTKWMSVDANFVRTALGDIRTVLGDQHANVKTFGAKGDGVTDDTAAIQAAINATEGRPLYLPKGKYITSSTLLIGTRSNRICGDYGNRNVDAGTEIVFMGTGPAIQIGVDNGHAWNVGDYDGPQDQRFENLWVVHGAPNTPLASVPGAPTVYKAGAYGIWDWRGGQIVLENVGLEHFEANFVGIESDINSFHYLISLYSKYGLYFGPRSDQQTIRDMYSFGCDRAITIDGAGQTRIECAQLVACGTDTASTIEIRRGSHGTRLANCWFERSAGGYQGTDGAAFVSVGEVNGYSAGGSIPSAGGVPNTASVQGCVIEAPHCYNILPAVANHTKYLAAVGKCTGFVLADPSEYANSSLSNFDALVGIQAAQAPSSSDTQIEMRGVSSSSTIAKLYTNLGAGAPTVSILATGINGVRAMTVNGAPFSIMAMEAAATGADRLDISQQGNLGNIWMVTPNYGGGQTARLRLSRSQQTTTASPGAPTSGTWERGDMVRVVDPSQSGFAEFICVGSGTPGNWAPANLVHGGEIAPASIGASQNNYNPTSLSTAEVLMLTASGAFSITGFATGVVTNTNTGRWLWVYNIGANNITLTHQDAASTAANRIIGRAGANTVLTPNTGCALYYSPSQLRWIVMGDTL